MKIDFWLLFICSMTSDKNEKGAREEIRGHRQDVPGKLDCKGNIEIKREKDAGAAIYEFTRGFMRRRWEISHTENFFEIVLNQPEIRLYSPFSD